MIPAVKVVENKKVVSGERKIELDTENQAGIGD